MRGGTMRSTVAVVGLAIAAGLIAVAAPASAGNLHVHVTGFRNGKGDLLCALFSSADGFPESGSIAQTKTPANGGGAECVFKDIGPGRYAVAVVHDENGNGKLDRIPLFGIPTEGYGVSNNKTYSTHAPRFEESTFAYDGQADMTVEIGLRY